MRPANVVKVVMDQLARGEAQGPLLSEVQRISVKFSEANRQSTQVCRLVQF